MIQYELYPVEGNFTGVIPKPYVTALGGESYKYVGGRKSRRKKSQKRKTMTKTYKTMTKTYKNIRKSRKNRLI